MSYFLDDCIPKVITFGILRGIVFSQILFLLLNLLLFANAQDQTAWPIASQQPTIALAVGVGSYLVLLIILYWQNRQLQRRHIHDETIQSINNVELIIFFSFYYFATGAHRFFIANFQPFGQTVALIFSLTLYFIALHLGQQPLKNNRSTIVPTRFLIPFTFPFLLFIIIAELEPLFNLDIITNLIGEKGSYPLKIAFMFAINIAFLLIAIIFLPPLAVLIWNCPPLPDASLEKTLNILCEKTHFKHAGLRIWTVMKNNCTAAIIGVVSPLRYVLFTPKLIHSLPPRAIAAVLAHEIGHSQKYHLWIYPFILLGMATVGTLALLPIYTTFSTSDSVVNGGWQAAHQVILFLTFALTIALYFRIVFGYFSRLFEREADLYVLEIGLPANDMIEALDTLGTIYGNIHNKPNWHHYSIQQRIDCLKEAAADPSAIYRHHRRIRRSLLVYTLCLVPLISYLAVKIASAT